MELSNNPAPLLLHYHIIWARFWSWLQDGYSQILDCMCLALWAWRTMAPLRCAAKFDPFLSLDCAPTPSTLVQSKERKGSNFSIWQHCFWPVKSVRPISFSPFIFTPRGVSHPNGLFAPEIRVRTRRGDKRLLYYGPAILFSPRIGDHSGSKPCLDYWNMCCKWIWESNEKL